MSTALAPLEPKDLTELKGVAEIFAKSGLFSDTRQMAQAFVKIMAGREVGIGAFAAMQNIHIIDGKPTFSANLMAAAVKRSEKYDYRVTTLTNTECKIAFLQHGEPLGESVLTMAEADKLGLNKTKNGVKTNWKKFPRNMLFARALSNGVRWYCPDVFDMPAYTPDEFDADDIEQPVFIIDSDDAQASTEPPADPVPPPDAGETDAPAADEVYDPLADESDFTPAAWIKLQTWAVANGYADNDHHAYQRLCKIAGVPDDVRQPIKAYEFVREIAKLNVAAVAKGFIDRAKAKANAQAAE